MKKAEIRVGGLYLAKVSGQVTTVRVDAIDDGFPSRSPRGGTATSYAVTNLKTGRKTTFRSAAKFRCKATEAAAAKHDHAEAESIMRTDDLGRLLTDAGKLEGEQGLDPIVCKDVVMTPAALTVTVEESTHRNEGKQNSDPIASGCGVESAVAGSVTVSLAGRIAAARVGRQVGTSVAGMVPNDEQESILAIAHDIDGQTDCGRVLVVGAGAGTGKTATLKMLEQVLSGRGQYTAFNTSLVAESKAKFVKASCNTTHSLAFRAVGKLYQHRLGGERMRSGQIARVLGIENVTVILKGQGPPDENGKPTDKTKTLQAEWLAGQVMVAIKKFLQSADREVGEHHFHYTDGLDVPIDGKRGWDNNNLVRKHLLPFAHKAWDDMFRLDGQLPFSHDCYVKIFQLGEGDDRPIIAADYILLDEAQDTAPVFLDILRQQTHALLVLVGDDCQQIYEWRGACNAMKAFKDAPRRLLSQSYRFGQAVADVANSVLATLEEPTDLVMRGSPDVPSRVAEVVEPRCYLYRTNAGALGRVMTSRKEGKRPCLMGTKDYVSGLISWCQAAIDLQAKRGTRHSELACFSTWGEVEEYAKTDEGSDLRLMVKLVNDFGAKEIQEALKDMPKEEDADLVVSTAHKSKGREWNTVKLGPDFPTANKMSDPDRRLLYVAATRAKLTLDITECPPFCGAHEFELDPNSRWIPGLCINYTKEQPTVEEQASAIASPPRIATTATPAPVGNPVHPPVQDAAVIATGGGNGKFTWTKFGGGNGWAVRGPANVPIGTSVTVRRKDNSEQVVSIRRVMYRYDDAWIYGI